MADRITGLQVFSRVAALGSLSGAARALGMSQTMATKHIGALEQRLGVRLLHRSTRRLSLTEAGRKYLDSAERILADLEEADAAVTAEAQDVRGTLRLNAPVSFGMQEIAPLLGELARRHPELNVDLSVNDRYVDPIEEGWDLVVRIGNLKPSSLVARRLAPCRVVVAAAPSYLERHGTPRTITDLAGHNCLGYTLASGLGPDRWAFGRDGKTIVTISGTLRANNGSVLGEAAAAGLGIIFSPTFLVSEALRDGRLVALALDQEPTQLAGVHAVYPGDRRPPAKVRAAIDFFIEHFHPVPPWDRVAGLA